MTECTTPASVRHSERPRQPEPGSEPELQALLEQANPDPLQIVALLDEAHPLYQGLGAAAIVRIRGALIMALSRNTLPREALPYLLEELNAPSNAYLTAAAAFALRALTKIESSVSDALTHALTAIRLRDDLVVLDSYGGYTATGRKTTATEQIHRTLRHFSEVPLNGAAKSQDCCGNGSTLETHTAEAARRLREDLLALELQDHNGEKIRFGEFFSGQRSLLTFFYTRCDNPFKCPTTMTKLGAIQRHLDAHHHAAPIRTAAITYDPDWDTALRLEQYRRSWGAESTHRHRIFRTPRGFDILRYYFGLGVGYGDNIVNRHRIEAFVLDSGARIVFRNTRRQLDIDRLVTELLR